MATKVEAGSTLAFQVLTEPALREADALGRLAGLPSVVQCGTIEELLRHVAPEQAHSGTPQCWEDSWQQVLQAMGTQSLPYIPKSEKLQSGEACHPPTCLEPERTPEEVQGTEVERLRKMAAKVETGSMLAVQVRTEPGPQEADASGKLPSLVQCGTIEELLRHVAPEQAHSGAAQCWEDSWQQVLQVMGTESLPCIPKSETLQSREAHHPPTGLEPARTPEEFLPGVEASSEAKPMLSLPWNNTWALKFHLEDDIEAYLEAFEGVARACQWPREEWVARLKPYLSGQALLACSVSECPSTQDYDLVKERILNQYGVTPEKQRQCFRQFRYQEAEGPREVCKKLQALGRRWLKPEKHTKEQILELLFLEQYLTILPQEMQSWVRECSPDTCAQAVDLAEGFQLGKQPPVPFREVCVKFASAEWALLSEEQKALYCEVMLENFRNVSTLGVPLQKPKLITQIEERGEPCFEDESSGTITEDSSKGNALLLAFKKLVREKRPAAKKGQIVEEMGDATATKANLDYSGPVGMVNREFSTPEKQGHTNKQGHSNKQGHANTSPSRNRPTKRQAPAPKGKNPKRRIQETPLITKLASRPQMSQSPLQGETSGGQGVNTVIATPKPRKHKKRPGQQDRPPKLKKQSSLQGEPPILRTTLEASVGPPKLKKERPLPDDTPPQEKSQPQEEKQQPPPVKGRFPETAVPIITWHPPFSASVLSDLACPDCGRAFKQRADVRRHRYVHTKEKPYACKQCDKRFGHPSNLHIHLRTHSGERPYKCPECGKAFTQSCNLRTHRQIHSGSKPFCCCVCGKSFLHRSILTVHQRVHTGERPYACSACPKRFRNSSSLVQHVRTHTGERPYACQVCEQRFSQRSHLVKHTRVHPGATGSPPKSSLDQQKGIQPNSKDSCGIAQSS